MKRILLLIACVALSSHVWAEGTRHNGDFEGVRISDVELSHQGDMLNISMIMELGSRNIKSDRATIYTPILYNGENEITLPSAGVYGRNSYFSMLRAEEHHGSMPLDWQLMRKDLPAEINYVADIEYEPWMNGSRLALVEQIYGGYHKIIAQGDVIIGEYREPTIVPIYLFVVPERVECDNKSYTRTGEMWFEQNESTINPHFGNNKSELSKLNILLDSLSNNPNATVKHLEIEGSASPEGEMELNTELAHERAAVLLAQIRGYVNVPNRVLTMAYNTDNWSAVSNWVAKSNIANRDAIVRLLSSKLSHEALNTALMERYPKEYQTILTGCYPTLRRAKYMMEYTTESYCDVDRIVAIAVSAPSTLSNEELNIAAANLDEQSPEFERVVLAIVAREPNNEAANINAANVSMRRGELNHAERYLKRAGTSAEADYARAIHAILKGHYGEAKRLLTKVSNKIAHATTLLQELDKAGV